MDPAYQLGDMYVSGLVRRCPQFLVFFRQRLNAGRDGSAKRGRLIFLSPYTGNARRATGRSDGTAYSPPNEHRKKTLLFVLSCPLARLIYSGVRVSRRKTCPKRTSPLVVFFARTAASLARSTENFRRACRVVGSNGYQDLVASVFSWNGSLILRYFVKAGARSTLHVYPAVGDDRERGTWP